MQHPWLLPFLHPLTTAPPIQLTLPPPPHQPHHHPHHPHHVQQPHPHAHHHPHQLPSTSMGLTLQPMLTPSGALLLPALQQNAAAAVAAFAAAAAAAAHQQGSAAAAYSMANTPVLMAPFQQRSRLKVHQTYTTLSWTLASPMCTDLVRLSGFWAFVYLPESWWPVWNAVIKTAANKCVPEYENRSYLLFYTHFLNEKNSRPDPSLSLLTRQFWKKRRENEKKEEEIPWKI